MNNGSSSKRRRPGIQEVADASGFSVSTVSRALNGYTDVSAKTLEKIKQVAHKIGYSPNYAATVLRSNRTMVITYIASRPWTRFVDPFHLEMLEGLEKILGKERYDLHVVMARDFDSEFEVIKRLVEQSRCDGLLFGRTKEQDDRVDYLMERNFPFVSLGRTLRQDHDWIDRDHFRIGLDATRHMCGLGHTRIAVVTTPSQFVYSKATLRGYHQALAESGISPLCEYERDLSPEKADQDVIAEFFSLPDPPTAIVCGNDVIAINVMEALQKRGLKAGKDVAVIGCDNVPIASYLDPPLTTFTQDNSGAGETMAHLLLSRLRGREEAKSLIIESHMVQRESDGASAK